MNYKIRFATAYSEYDTDKTYNHGAGPGSSGMENDNRFSTYINEMTNL